MNSFFAPPLFALFLPVIPLVCALFLPANRARLRYLILMFSLAGTFLAWFKLFALVQDEGVYVYSVGGPLLKTLVAGGGFLEATLLYLDFYAVFGGVILSLLAFLIPLLMKKRFSQPRRGALDTVFYCLSLVASLSIVATADLFSFYFWVQLGLLSLCCLVALRNGSIESQKAAMKNLVGFGCVSAFMFLGIVILSVRYNQTLMPALAPMIENGIPEKAAFVLILLPLLFFMALPPFHRWFYEVHSSSESSVFVQAFLLFSLGLSLGLLRICFSLMGAVFAGDTLPFYLILLSVISLLCLLKEISRLKNKEKLVRAFMVFQSALFFLALSVSFFALKSPFYVAQYGLPALQGALLLLLFYPVVASVLIFLQDISENSAPFSFLFLFVAVLLIGLPPFAGYTSRLLIVYSVFVLNPLLATVVFFSLFWAIVALIRTQYETRTSEPLAWRGAVWGKKSSSAFLAVGILFIFINAVSFFPVSVLSHLITPAVQSLINKGEYALPISEEEGGGR